MTQEQQKEIARIMSKNLDLQKVLDFDRRVYNTFFEFNLKTGKGRLYKNTERKIDIAIKLLYSYDGRTNKWRATCLRCDKSFEPATTRLRYQDIICPKCQTKEYVDYNNLQEV